MRLVFDIGGTNTRIAISPDGQKIIQSSIIPTTQDFDQTIHNIKKESVKLLNGQKPTKIGCGIAVVLDKEKSTAIKASNLQGWVNQPLKKTLENSFECPVSLENDSVVGGLGEVNFGAGKDYKIVVFLTIGTGCGGARFINGKLDEKTIGFEPGHQIIHPNGNDCNCGGKGHLESYIAGPYLEKLHQKKANEIILPQIWDNVAKNLAIGLTNTIVHWSPEIVVLGGSVTKSIPLATVTDCLRSYLTIFPKTPILKKASLGDNAGLYGALILT